MHTSTMKIILNLGNKYCFGDPRVNFAVMETLDIYFYSTVTYYYFCEMIRLTDMLLMKYGKIYQSKLADRVLRWHSNITIDRSFSQRFLQGKFSNFRDCSMSSFEEQDRTNRTAPIF